MYSSLLQMLLTAISAVSHIAVFVASLVYLSGRRTADSWLLLIGALVTLLSQTACWILLSVAMPYFGLSHNWGFSVLHAAAYAEMVGRTVFVVGFCLLIARMQSAIRRDSHSPETRVPDAQSVPAIASPGLSPDE